MRLFGRARDPRNLSTAQRRRRSILEATLRVIAAGGTDAVTHRRVAGRAKVPLGSTTYYFASREELLREAFRHYAAEVFDFLERLEREMPQTTARELVAFVVEVARREFTDPAMVLVEYELILRAARDEVLAREFTAYERGLASRLAEWLERLGAEQPFDAARTVIALVRGFELERLTRADASLKDLEHRLLPVVGALTSAPNALPKKRPSARRTVHEHRAPSHDRILQRGRGRARP